MAAVCVFTAARAHIEERMRAGTLVPVVVLRNFFFSGGFHVDAHGDWVGHAQDVIKSPQP